MRATLLLPSLCAGLGLVVFGIALKERATRHDIEREIAERAARRVRTEQELRRSEQRLSGAESDRRRILGDTGTPPQTSATPAPSGTPVPPSPIVPNSGVRAALRDDPQLQNLQLAATHAKLQSNYRPLLDTLKLTEAQQAEFLKILQRRAEQEMDLAAIFEKNQASPDDPIFAKLQRQLADEIRAALTPVLGDAGLQRFEDYARSVPAREFVNDFAGATVVAGVGLTTTQVEALTAAAANASASYGRGGIAAVQTIDWDKVLADYAHALTEPQLALLRKATIPFRNANRLRGLAERK